MKALIEVNIPEFNWVEVPVLFNTPIGEVGKIEHVEAIKSLITMLQRQPDRARIINLDYPMLKIFCDGLISNYLTFIEPQFKYMFSERLMHFLKGFREGVGYIFDDYTFHYEVFSNGKKVQFKEFTMLFDSEDEAIRHAIKLNISQKPFAYTLQSDSKSV